ncbi:MAG: LysR family transcriptional regulator [Sulfitobacter sp.]|nr:LysR family transcriptional regulator [Sulfitobacter sp.]
MHICMDWRSISFDWNRARAFLVTAEEGSYSAAARALGLTQPTLGRQVTALEEELGVTLFDRTPRGLSLTPSGLEVVEQARAMGQAALGLSRVALGQSQSVEGLVRITASEIASAYTLPPVLAELRAAHPGIQIEVVASDELRDLRRREADIALRSVRPADPDLIARKLKGGEAHLYASEVYLERLDGATTPDLLQADFIGFAENTPLIEGLNQAGIAVTAEHFALTSASILVQWQMVQAGLGVGIMTEEVGDVTPGVRRAAPDMPPFSYDIWLVAHRELATSRRLRIVFDALVDAFG